MVLPKQEIVLVDFHNTAVPAWRVVNDTVMGGVSESTITNGEQGMAVFSGTVSLKNFGGFCSVHLHNTAVHDLSVYDGISLRVKGDGKQYKLILKTDPELNGFSYHFPFVTKKDAWITVYAPFREFIPRFRGAVLSDVPPLNPAEIKSFGIMISDKQEGQFHLALESIKAYAL